MSASYDTVSQHPLHWYAPRGRFDCQEFSRIQLVWKPLQVWGEGCDAKEDGEREREREREREIEAVEVVDQTTVYPKAAACHFCRSFIIPGSCDRRGSDTEYTRLAVACFVSYSALNLAWFVSYSALNLAWGLIA
jgi:hypothetical protein